MRASSFRTAAPSAYRARSHFCRTNSNRWIIIVCCVKWHVALHRSRSFVFWISHVDSIPLCHRRKPQSTISLGILLPLLPPIFSVVTIFYNVLSIWPMNNIWFHLRVAYNVLLCLQSSMVNLSVDVICSIRLNGWSCHYHPVTFTSQNIPWYQFQAGSTQILSQ